MSALEKDGLHGHTPPEDSGFTDVGKRKRNKLSDVEPISATNKLLALTDPLEDTSLGIGINKSLCSVSNIPSTTNVVIVMKSTDNLLIFNNPQKVTDLLNNSPFGKYIIEDSPRVLGRGAGCRFEISDLRKLEVDLQQVTKLGPHSIKCWVPKSGGADSHLIQYGKIGPVDFELPLVDITDSIKVLGPSPARILDITRITTFSNSTATPRVPTLQLKIKFLGAIPERVSIGHLSYKVYPWVYPVLRCYHCWQYGHGSLTCRATVRCATCSGYHEDQGCLNPPRCFICVGNHPLNDKQCPVYRKAAEITHNFPGVGLGADSPLTKALQRLNPVKNLVSTIPRTSPTTATPVPNVHGRKFPPQAFHKTYASVLDEMSDVEEDHLQDTTPMGRFGKYFPSPKSPPRKRPNTEPVSDMEFLAQYQMDAPSYNREPFPQRAEINRRVPRAPHDQNSSSDDNIDPSSFWSTLISKCLPVLSKFFQTYCFTHSIGKALIAISSDVFEIFSIITSHFNQD